MDDDTPMKSQVGPIDSDKRTASECGSSFPANRHLSSNHAKKTFKNIEMTPYRYSPLIEPRSFRLLRIPKPPQDDRQLIFEIFHASLDDPPPYMTMSYVWGTSGHAHHLQLVSGQGLMITENLHIALPYMVRHCTDEYLWCDQLCINQQDLDERAAQVTLMAQIYSKATAVLVWLGEETTEVGKLQELLHIARVEPQDYTWRERWKSEKSLVETHERVKDHVWGFALARVGPADDVVLGQLQTEELRQNPQVKQEADEIFRGFASVTCSILNSTWFSRVWVVQEALLSTQVLMLWGDTLIAPYNLQMLSNCLFPWAPNDLERPLIDYDDIQDTAAGGPVLGYLIGYHRLSNSSTRGGSFMRSLYGCLCNCRALALRGRLKATDRRDMVYGMLGMTSVEDRYMPQPDYRISWQMAFIQTARAIIAARKDLDILFTCDGVDRASSKRPEGLPTWVPDWSCGMKRDFRLPSQKRRCSPIAHQPQLMTRYDQLCVRGKRLGRAHLLAHGLPNFMEEWIRAIWSQNKAQLCSQEMAAFLRETTAMLGVPHDLIAWLCWCFTSKPEEREFGDSLGISRIEALDLIIEVYKTSVQLSGAHCESLGSGSSRSRRDSNNQEDQRFNSRPQWHESLLSNRCPQGNALDDCEDDDCEVADLHDLILDGKAALKELTTNPAYSIVTTTDDLLVLCNNNIEKHDVVCLLRGSDLPIVLRELASGFYQFVSGAVCLEISSGKEIAPVEHLGGESDEYLILV